MTTLTNTHHQVSNAAMLAWASPCVFGAGVTRIAETSSLAERCLR